MSPRAADWAKFRAGAVSDVEEPYLYQVSEFRKCRGAIHKAAVHLYGAASRGGCRAEGCANVWSERELDFAISVELTPQHSRRRVDVPDEWTTAQ
jgi:hypothetical protein